MIRSHSAPSVDRTTSGRGAPAPGSFPDVVRATALRHVCARSCLAVALSSALSPAAHADSLSTSNQSTLARGFALPAVGHATPALADGRWTASLDLTSEFVDKAEGGESIVLDGETARYGLRYERAWRKRGAWNVEIPLLHTGGGFLDGPIEDWHGVFGLPQGGRKESARDRYRYRYVRDGVTVLEKESGGAHLGDVQVGAGWKARDTMMLRGVLKLPTGDEDELTGGNLGGAVWADMALPFEPGSIAGGFVSAGLSINEKSEVLEDLHNGVVPFGAVGFDLRLLRTLKGLVQLYAHGPLYDDTDVDALERPGLQFSLGGRWCANGKSPCAELSFQEDMVVASSPDFSLRFALLLPSLP